MVSVFKTELSLYIFKTELSLYHQSYLQPHTAVLSNRMSIYIKTIINELYRELFSSERVLHSYLIERLLQRYIKRVTASD